MKFNYKNKTYEIILNAGERISKFDFIASIPNFGSFIYYGISISDLEKNYFNLPVELNQLFIEYGAKLLKLKAFE